MSLSIQPRNRGDCSGARICHGSATAITDRRASALRVPPAAPWGIRAWTHPPIILVGRPAARTWPGGRRGAAWESRKRGAAGRGGSGGPMQDTENVAAPEAAEERAEPGQQQLDAEPPPGEEPPRLADPGTREAAGGEDAEAEAEARPGPEVPAEPAANGEEAASATPTPSPPPPEELPAPAVGEVPGEQARDAAAEARSDGAGGEPGGAAEDGGGADEPSFSDPEDFVDDVSEEGEAAGSGCAGVLWAPNLCGVTVPLGNHSPPVFPHVGKVFCKGLDCLYFNKKVGAGWSQPGELAIPATRYLEGGRGQTACTQALWLYVQWCGT